MLAQIYPESIFIKDTLEYFVDMRKSAKKNILTMKSSSTKEHYIGVSPFTQAKTKLYTYTVTLVHSMKQANLKFCFTKRNKHKAIIRSFSNLVAGTG